MSERYRVERAVSTKEGGLILATPPGTPWIYQHNTDNSARFVLGVEGPNPLVCVGLNPSTAAPNDLDRTVTKVTRFAEQNGFEGWVMLNLYPQRSTNPDCLHRAHHVGLVAENHKRIVDLVGGRTLTIVAAWGNLITSRPYLKGILADIVAAPKFSLCNWVSLGPVLQTGHPRHPSRAAYTHALQTFDVATYVRALQGASMP